MGYQLEEIAIFCLQTFLVEYMDPLKETSKPKQIELVLCVTETVYICFFVRVSGAVFEIPCQFIQFPKISNVHNFNKNRDTDKRKVTKF